jgi:hypothetical protein
MEYVNEPGLAGLHPWAPAVKIGYLWLLALSRQRALLSASAQARTFRGGAGESLVLLRGTFQSWHVLVSLSSGSFRS